MRKSFSAFSFARCALFAVVLLVLPEAWSAEIHIGLASAITSLDPHFHALTPNQNVAEHIFDTLIARDADQKLKPALAVSWRPVAPDAWEFKLRPGVKFHDGTDFSADDVKFSLQRPALVPNSPSPYTIYTRSIAEVQVVDRLTIMVHTHGPNPILPGELSVIAIVSSQRARNATTADFNAGPAAIGTGPFKLISWNHNDRIELARNGAYWGRAAAWDRVIFHILSNSAARTAALLAGTVQAIEQVPTADIGMLRARPDVEVVRSVSNRLIYLHVDTARDKSPKVQGVEGAPLVGNPLKDARVRLAISKAINRDALRDRVMEGMAVTTGQLMPAGFSGYDPSLMPERYDPAAARALLAQAGYPAGFRLVLSAPSDRYVNDREVAMTIAQMLSRVGIATTVEALPSAVYFARAAQLQFSLMLLGWSADTAESSSPLRALLATHDPEHGMGSSNRGRYSNPEFDRLLREALGSVEGRGREELLRRATQLAIGELGIIPLYHQVNIWALRRSLGYVPRADERTYAHEIRPRTPEVTPR